MSFTVRELPKAKQDKDSIFRWLHERSPAGAISWLDAYDVLVECLCQDALVFGEAPENRDCEFHVRQAFFKTPRGRVYRALFFVEHEDVFHASRTRSGPGAGFTGRRHLMDASLAACRS